MLMVNKDDHRNIKETCCFGDYLYDFTLQMTVHVDENLQMTLLRCYILIVYIS